MKFKHDSKAPSFDTWLKEVFACIKLEKKLIVTHCFFQDFWQGVVLLFRLFVG